MDIIYLFIWFILSFTPPTVLSFLFSISSIFGTVFLFSKIWAFVVYSLWIFFLVHQICIIILWMFHNKNCINLKKKLKWLVVVDTDKRRSLSNHKTTNNINIYKNIMENKILCSFFFIFYFFYNIWGYLIRCFEMFKQY